MGVGCQCLLWSATESHGCYPASPELCVSNIHRGCCSAFDFNRYSRMVLRSTRTLPSGLYHAGRSDGCHPNGKEYTGTLSRPTSTSHASHHGVRISMAEGP